MKDFKISKSNAITNAETFAIADATVIQEGDAVLITSGLVVRAAAASAGAMIAAEDHAGGDGVVKIKCYNDPETVFEGTGDAVFAATQRGTEVDLVIAPGYLTTGAAGTTVAATWAAITDGSLRVTIDGTAYNVDAIDFTGDTTMALVAATIQAAIRVATSALETVTYDSDTEKFTISSVTATYSGTVTVLSTSTGTVGTDVTGSDFLSGQLGQALVTDPAGRIDVGASSTDVFKIVPTDDAGVVGSTEGIKFRLNKTL